MDRIEAIIIRGLMYEETYTRRVIPFIKTEYFEDREEKAIYKIIHDFLDNYHTLPNAESILVEADKDSAFDLYEGIATYIKGIEKEKEEKPNVEWLVEQTEIWCQEKALYNAMTEALSIMGTKKANKGSIPKLLQDALAVSFDSHVGHDYLEDAQDRYDFYQKVEQRIPFHLEYFNKITKNGVPNKTLNVILAGTGVGKSLYMCDLAAGYLMQGKNVLYITLEMAEERIAERIDANLMDEPLDELKGMTKARFNLLMDKINSKTKGRLVIKEYATAQAHVGHFRHLMNELAMKKKFTPDVVFIDYLNICASSRMKIGSGGMYEFVKAIAEELRGFGVEFNVPVWTATQTNRAGFNNNDPDLTNTSESFGLPATADFMFALVADEQLTAMNQLLVKILKNRYGDVNMRNKETGNIMNRFLIGIDRSKMKLYNLDDSAQNDLNNETPGSRPSPPPRTPVLLRESTNDETAPWFDAEEDIKTPSAEPKLKSEPVFDIDNEEFSSATEDVERRRQSTKSSVANYQPRSVSTNKLTIV
jgi:replicative DNA helicase